MPSNPALDPVPFGHWTLRDEAAQRRSAPRWPSQMGIALRFWILATLFLATAAHAQGAIEFTPKAVKPRPAPYETISFATEGPAHSFGDGPVRGKHQRLIVLNVGLAYDYPTLRLETLTYGDEGCCRRVVAAWELDMNKLAGLGLSLPEAATNELHFVQWRSPYDAEFKFGELSCTFQGIGKKKVKVSCSK